MTEPLILPEELGRALRLSPNPETVIRFAKRHNIPIIRFSDKTVRFRPEDVQQAIERHRETSPPSSQHPEASIAGRLERETGPEP